MGLFHLTRDIRRAEPTWPRGVESPRAHPPVVVVENALDDLLFLELPLGAGAAEDAEGTDEGQPQP